MKNFIPLPLEESNHLLSQIVYKKVFSKEECETIIKLQGTPSPSYIRNQDGKTSLENSVSLRMENNNQWLFTKLATIAREANNTYFKFDIANINEIRVNSYRKNDYSDWHLDIGNGPASTRKLNLVIFLSDEKDYEGGALRWNPEVPHFPQEQGTVVLFPSYILYRNELVISGTKFELNSWINGHSFR